MSARSCRTQLATGCDHRRESRTATTVPPWHDTRRGPTIDTFRSRLRPVWSSHRDKILYLVVGGWNTLFTWLSFSVLYYLLNGSVYPSIILVLGYVIASVNGFLGFRFIVFGTNGSHPVLQYLKYQAVYLPMLGINLVFLPFMLSHTSLNAYVIQAMYGAFSVVFGYLGSKYFAFRRARPGNIQDRS